MKTTSVIIASSLLGLALASPALEKKAACNADNCARAVTGTAMGLATRSARLAGCQSYQACTVTPAASSTVTVTVAPSPVVIHSTEVDVYTSTVTVAPPATAAAGKRAAALAGSAVTSCPTAVPAYAAKACTASSAFASACSCAGITRSTTTVSAAPTTVTVTGTAPPNTIYTVDTTISSAVVQTVTASTGGVPPASMCTSFDEVLDGPDQPVTYYQYYAGSGTTENANNPGNRFNSPITLTYAGPKCSAASNCAGYAAFANYFSFDLHYLKSSNNWECKLYFDENKQSSYFNVPNANVGEAYGYSV